MLLKFMIDLGSFPETIISVVSKIIPVCLLPGRMVSRVFHAHGHLCASHPWEVLIGTLTVTISLMSMSLWATNTKLCGWNYVCQSEQDFKSSDLLIIALTRCLAVMYIYLQFRNLRKLGSKYLLGLAGVFTIFSSFIFSIAFANLIGFDLSGLNEALPFFLLLIDLSKASALARFSLTASVQDEFQKNIGSGMAVMGPAITLDAIVATLALGVGTLSGVRILETMCWFGCLSVVANYLAFMTFYPACLSLVFEISRDRNDGKPLKQLQLLAKVLQKEEEEKKPNPVTQRVKIIMSAGLVLVHARSRFIVEDIPSPGGASGLSTDGPLDYIGQDHRVQPEIPLWQFYLGKALLSNLDYGAAFLLTILLTVKYVLFDDKVEHQIQELLKAESSETNTNKSSLDPNNSCHLNNNMPIRTKGFKPLQSNGTNGVHCNGTNTTIKMNGTAESIKANGAADPHKTSNGTLSPIDRECLDPKKNDFMPASFFLGGQDDSSGSDEDKEVVKEKDLSNAETQTDQQYQELSNLQLGKFIYTPKLSEEEPRTIDECVAIMNSDAGPEALTDEEVIMLVHSRHIPPYKLESILGNHIRGVAIRRQLLTSQLTTQYALESLPFMHYDYKYVEGSCCENVVGYVPVPVGVAGPLLMDGVRYHVPMATTEGCLVASTNRGCRAIEQSGGASCCVTNDGMTRGPVVRFQKAVRASEAKKWLETPENFAILKETFDTTSRFARLKKIHIGQAGRNLYIRLVSTTGDAMGMNMLSKGSEKALATLQEHFPDMEIISLSGNYCTDKKPAAINWIEGRGKSVVAEAIIKSNVVKNTLKTTVPALIELNTNKNLVGSAMAGSIGGFNAHASNIVTAIYIAAGQDPAQNVTSSNCLVMMEASGPLHDDLHITCTMPSIEVGTVGGGTVLPPQSSCLKMLGVSGSNQECPGDNARNLAKIVCASVLAGELSLMSALAAGHLVKSHLKHNRSVLNMAPATIKEEETPPSLRHAATAPGMCTNKAS